jgi:hypothetical protein
MPPRKIGERVIAILTGLEKAWRRHEARPRHRVARIVSLDDREGFVRIGRARSEELLFSATSPRCAGPASLLRAHDRVRRRRRISSGRTLARAYYALAEVKELAAASPISPGRALTQASTFLLVVPLQAAAGLPTRS